MSLLPIQGLQDAQALATFGQAASGLGLMGRDAGKLQSFFAASAQTGALAAGQLNADAVADAVAQLQSRGVVSPGNGKLEQAASLLESAKQLGITATNYRGQVDAIHNKAQQFGLTQTGNPAGTGATVAAGEAPPNSGKAVTWNRLHVAPFTFQDVLGLEITQCINEHSRMLLEGTLPEGTSQQDYVQKTDEHTPVEVSYFDDRGHCHYLFRGLVKSIRERTVSGFKHLTIEAVSYSSCLDVKRCSRSFQRSQAPYKYIFDRINRAARTYVPNPSGDVLWVEDSEANQTTGKLIVQYEETDWCFLRRMASHFQLFLLPDIGFNTAKIYLGLPPEKPQGTQKPANGNDPEPGDSGSEFSVAAYEIRRDPVAYAVAKANFRHNTGAGLSENDFTYCRVESLDVLQLGQKVEFLKRTFYVRDIHTVMNKGVVQNTYTLVTKQGLQQDDGFNHQLAGISLQGIIKKVNKDQVKVHIKEIDAKWDEESQWYFPYTTVYSSPDGSGWYCMPEIGDNVRIYFPNYREEDSLAVSSVNLTPSKRGARTDPNSKIISTVHGKQLIMNPDGIHIISNENLLMTLTDAGGLTIQSDKQINMEAKEGIRIHSEEKIAIVGKEEIGLIQGANAVTIDKDKIQFSGTQVKMQP
jgi:hypothetical protein